MTEAVEQREKHINRRDLLTKVGMGTLSVALGSVLLRPGQAAAAALWQPSWAGASNWPAGPQGERQKLTVTLGAGQVATLSGGYVRLFYRDSSSSVYQAAQAVSEVVIPIVDGGVSGGTFDIEVENLQNWAGIAAKPVPGHSLTRKEIDLVAFNRLSEAVIYGATRATLIWWDLADQQRLIDVHILPNINTYLERLRSDLSLLPALGAARTAR